MKILVTGATGYLGNAAAQALRKDGHAVSGLARSEATAARLCRDGFGAVTGDFADPASLASAIADADPDVVVSTASAGAGGGDADTFRVDRDAVLAMLHALGDHGKSLIFTSGSAVFGVLGAGEQSGHVFDENTVLPLPPEIFAPPSAHVPDIFVAGFGAAMAARVATEKAVTMASGVRGIVIRPGNVYGHGGSYDVPAQIEMARARGVAPHMGAGGTTHGYVHIDDLAELYRLAVVRGTKGSAFHGVAGEVRQKDLAAAISRMIGAGDRTDSLTLEEMYGAGGSAGISLSANKRLSADLTCAQLRWEPRRTDILHDVEFGSYAL
jgi:nucleoside-diphosphate-sugar epimerase